MSRMRRRLGEAARLQEHVIQDDELRSSKIAYSNIVI